jgi:hypothetical protein
MMQLSVPENPGKAVEELGPKNYGGVKSINNGFGEFISFIQLRK